MKELSIEEKANAYDNVRNKIAARFGSNVAQEIFSEYEESEDEKIRKELINFLQLPHPKFVGERKQEKWLVWLEKQGEKTKPIEGFDNEFERQISHLIASAIDREHEYNEGYVKWTANALLEYAKRELEKQGSDISSFPKEQQVFMQKYISLDKITLIKLLAERDANNAEIIESFEKQGEKKCIDDLTQQEAMDIAVAKCFEQGGQKPVIEMKTPEESLGIDSETYNEVVNDCIFGENKPKFNIGDWIVSDLEDVNEDFRLCKIIGIEGGCYAIQSANGCKGYNFFETWESDYHLWSIEDAKDGDVLVNGNEIVIFKKSTFNEKDLSGCMFVHCQLRDKNGYWYTIGGINPTNYTPATKEQRDLLSQKMHEAGYTFDFEKKEFKKIEPLTDFEKAFQGMCCDKNKQFAKECCKTLLELAKKQLQSKRNEFELDETSYKVGVKRVLENPESY